MSAETHCLVLARAHIERHFVETLDIAELSRQTHLSWFYFIRAFASAYGITPHQFAMECRIRAARLLLAQGTAVIRACVDVGFSSPSSFSALFRRRVGQTPARYRARAMRQYLAQRYVPYCFLCAAGIQMEGV